MKPLKLSMSAFGPYAEREEIDFSRLAGRRLFLIHGPTGGGKTIILDAICFALYGQSSGAERRDRAIRSDHADAQTATEVTFEFALGRERFRVWRHPRQERPRKRGEGMIPVPPRAELHKLKEDWELIASGWKDVTAGVEEMIGFRCEQFRQVVVLPQGEFRRLLSAESRERQEILAVLFNTRLYRQIEEALSKAARELKDGYNYEKGRRDTLLEQAEVESLAALESSAAQRKDDLSTAGQRRAAASKLEEHALSILKKGREDDRLLREAREARRTVEELRARAEAIDAREREADLARRVLGLADLEAELLSRESERDEKKTRLDEVVTNRAAAETEHQACARALAKSLAGLERRDAAGERVRRLKEFRTRAHSLDQARKDQEALSRSRAELLDRERDAASALDNARTRLDASAKELANLRDLARRADAVRGARDALENELNRLRRLQTLDEESRRSKEDLTRAQQKARRVESLLQRARARRDALNGLRERELAHRLALGLQPDEPCPVCGSESHPSPAQSGHAVPSDEDARLVQRRVVRLDEFREAVRDEVQELIALCSVKDGARRALEDELGQRKEMSLQELDRELSKARDEAAEAAAAEERSISVEARVETLEKEADKSGRSLAALGAELVDVDKKLAIAATVVEERRALLGDELNEERLDEQVAAAEEESRRLDGAHRIAEKSFRESEKSLHGLAQRQQALSEAHGDAVRAADRQARALDERIVASGFGSRGEFDDARRDQEEIDGMENDVRQYREEMAAAVTIAAERAAASQGLESPDLAGLEKASEEARAVLLQALGEQSALAEKVDRDTRQLASLKKIEGTMDNLDRRYEVVGTLADAACGRNEQKLTLERYVLAALFEEATRSATRRLLAMSRGRFALNRFEGHGDQRKAGGLELEVFDAWTGRTRPVATLSGGESFLAALSLALGLADVVQSFSGGIHLETIFVDEGFGTLDEESLALAISALEDLQEGGRLVGIISHVPELKERIGARLEISRTGQGSRTDFVLNYQDE